MSYPPPDYLAKLTKSLYQTGSDSDDNNNASSPKKRKRTQEDSNNEYKERPKTLQGVMQQQVEKLMQRVDKPVVIPERNGEEKPKWRPPKDVVQTVSGGLLLL